MNNVSKLIVAVVATSLLSVHAVYARDGVYTASAPGRNGDVPVQVTIKDNKIADIKILDWSETHPIADLPKQKIPAEIVKYQSLQVEAVSGATLTSFGILGAVENAIKQAGLDPDVFDREIPQPSKSTDTVSETGDVVVVGGGGAGLSAALAAAQMRRTVVLIEKSHYLGGNTSVAGGNFNAADPQRTKKFSMNQQRKEIVEQILNEKPKNELQKSLIKKVREQYVDFEKQKKTGLFDSPEFHALQTWKAGDYQGNLELVYELTKKAPVMERDLMKMGFVWRESSEQVMGSLWPRANRSANYASGVGFIDTFINEIKTKKLPVRFLLNTKAESFIMKDGRVVGVKAKAKDGRTYVVSAKRGVVLATGGFGANVEMRVKYDTIWNKKLGKDVNTTNVPSIQGDGIVMAEKIGADLIQMGNIQLLPTTDPYTGASSSKVLISTSVFVNEDGKRFVNETGRRDEISRVALQQPGQHFFLLGTSATSQIDENGRNKYGIKLDDLVKQKKVFVADSWDELAKKSGINAENLKKTVKEWIGFCKTLKGDPFGRPSCDPEVRLDGPAPYYANVMAPSVHHTMGGVKINTKGQVIDTKGKVIPGLWAAGEVTGGIHGANRVGGNAVPDALVFGRIAGQNAASSQAIQK